VRVTCRRRARRALSRLLLDGRVGAGRTVDVVVRDGRLDVEVEVAGAEAPAARA
jgi:ATP-dependent Clp protease ATP-binding subunit ClpC